MSKYNFKNLNGGLLMFFEPFLESFIPPVEEKAKQVCQVGWELETTGAEKAADALVALKTEYVKFFSDPKIYDQLLQWKMKGIEDPIVQRELDLLILRFKENMISEHLQKKIAQKECQITKKYATFRPVFNGKSLTENQIHEMLKSEQDISIRKKIWEHSKEVGSHLAPDIIAVVELRNEAARQLGYEDYFQMQLDLHEIDRAWLFSFLEKIEKNSQRAYDSLIAFLEEKLSERFSIGKEELYPWTWSDCFCQTDPISSKQLDALVQNEDLIQLSKDFYSSMGLDVSAILARSDLYEREKKNQHAFCVHIDRRGDVRTLNNLTQTLQWADTLLHELGHGVYEQEMDFSLPWLLREPPHMITTEAMALLAGSQVYERDFLKKFIHPSKNKKAMILEAENSRKRQQLIFSRWVMVMTYFEEELYRDPHQDLQKLWWDLVARYQKVKIPPHREGFQDWASKIHIGQAPVYYYSYLLGEVFASSLKALLRQQGGKVLWSSKSGRLLKEKLFSPANRYRWDILIEKVLGHPFSEEDWQKEFVGEPFTK